MKHNFLKKETDFVENLLKEGEKNISLNGLYSSAKALFLFQLKEVCDRPVLVITRDQRGAEELLHDLSFFFKWSACQNSSFLYFPSWDLLPYEYLSPQKEIVGERLKTLLELSQGKSSLLVTSLEPCLQLLIPQDELKRSILKFDLKDYLDLEIVANCLVSSGYEHVEIVEDRGEFSVRGGIIDVFPSNHSDPFRIELFGDEIESIRRFDVDSQVSVERVNSLIVMPVIEQILNKEILSKGIEKIKAEADSSKFPQKIINETINRLENIYPFSGVELLNPYFYSNMDSLIDYLDKDYLIVLDEPELIENKRRKFEELIYEEYDKAIARREFVPSPEKLFLNKEQFYTQINKRNTLEIHSLTISEKHNETESTVSVRQIPSFKDRIKDFIEQLKSWQKEGNSVVLTISSEGKATRFKELLLGYDVVLEVVVGDLSNGINLTESKTIFVSEHEIFGQQHKKKYKLTTGKQTFYRGLKDLKEGDLVVHVDYGIGLYQGEKDLEVEGGSGEFLDLLYADDEKLYLPVERLNLIQKYSGAGQGSPSLDKIGGVKWKKQKEKVKKSIKEMAEDLLKLYAAREIVKGHAYQEDSDLHRQFADAFEFVETEHQLKAIEDVLADMEKDKPMDRLICGDVGYGKTEVAMRAALKAVSDSKQVAFLVPTTILAQQHLNTFNKRFEGYPVKIDMLNRFRPPKIQKEIIKKVELGEVDVIIGTHRILQKDIKFKDLGLIVIDEEQRFGVKHKEKLKKLRKKVEVLTLTATPIPRTLHFSLMGVRDLSVIETPPKDRLAIKTYIHKFNEAAICQAIKKEVGRGGQVFFVHNWVASISSMTDYIKRIVPGINVDFAHGQMREHKLEKVMMKFINREIDVLICTTIIEAGLDIPSANTIIINRADRFGLSQLYQLRGRVGRDCHQAYAYLLVPDDMLLSDVTRKRLRAIEELSDLGSGFQLASRDMEIRGSGNYLGHQQSGNISAVGFDLYCKLMEETVREIKGEIPEQDFEPKINLHIRGFIPKDYIPNLNQRLEFYRRLYMTYDQENTDKILNELKDRYGPPPEPLKKLIAVLEIKLLCHQLKINDISLMNGKVKMKVMNETPISIERVMNSIENGTHRISFLNDNTFLIEIAGKSWNEICAEIKRSLKKLTVYD
jgi:transcription-repair coupling factor (superfamily II helicase)